MAKAAPKKTTKPAAKAAAKPGRRPAAAKTAKPTKATAVVKKPAAVKAPVVSKEELRAQLEKALATIATLRSKSREAVRAAKAAAAQIDELEGKLAQLEKKLAAQPKPVKAAPAPKVVKPRAKKAVEAAAPVEAEEPATEVAETVVVEDEAPIEE